MSASNRIRAVIVGLARTAVALVLLQNALLNLGLPLLLNRNPERLEIRYTAAWMWVPGPVQVFGLRVHVASPVDIWTITAARASGEINLHDLLERRFHADRVRARGVTVRRQLRAEDEAPPAAASRRTRWLVRLDDVVAEHVTEIWMGDHRLVGEARIRADLQLATPYVDLDGDVLFQSMDVDIGEIPLARAVVGELDVLVDSLDRTLPVGERLAAISATAALRADLTDLRFLDFYLGAVPWLSFAGAGRVELAGGVEGGHVRAGSAFQATFSDLIAHVASAEVSGTGTVRAEVAVGDDGLPRSHLGVRFDDFAVRADGRDGTLIEGHGFLVDAWSPDVRLDQPLSAVAVRLDLPPSDIPDLALYNSYLPSGVGLSLVEGVGTLHGQLRGSSEQRWATGDLYLDADDVVTRFDSFRVTADLALHAHLAEADLGAGRYDLSGSTLVLRRVGLDDRAVADARDRQRRWAASLTVSAGTIAVGAPVYLDATVHVACSDSVPFVRLFVEGRDLPPWAQRRLDVDNVLGQGRLQLGEDSLRLDPVRIRAEDYRVDLRFVRRGENPRGDLLVRAGGLVVGIALRGADRQVQIREPVRWFEAGEL